MLSFLNTSFITKIIVATFILLLPIKAVALTLGFLIFADLFTGIWKAIKNKEQITSRKMSETVSKMVLYQLAIIVAFVAETYIFFGIPITKVASGYIASTEIKSIFENIGTITGIDLWEKIKSLLKRPADDVKS